MSTSTSTQPDVDLGNLQRLMVTVTFDRDTSEAEIAEHCEQRAAQLGVAIGAELPWSVQAYADSDLMSYVLEVIPITPETLVALLEKGITRGLKLAAESLREYAGNGSFTDDEEALLNSAADILDAKSE